jgi:CheY-like chemotaxis protein
MEVSKVKILMAEDSEDDVILFRRALKRVGFENAQFVQDGQEVVEYLQGVGKYADRVAFPFPTWLVLDLKMPRMNGFEVLQWLRKNPACGVIPIIIFSSSALPEDVIRVYAMGGNSYFTKPSQYDKLVVLLELLIKYWCQAEVPNLPRDHRCP